jgi:hypothetical protein
VYHLSVGLPVDEWYRQYWPNLKVGDMVPGLCPRCGIDLRAGHRVTVRTAPVELSEHVPVGTPGTVLGIEAAEGEGELVYLVELEGAAVAAGRFRRADLSYVIGQKPST